MVHLVEKDLWLLIVEEVVRLRFPLTMVKLGRFFTPIQVDVPEVFDLVPTWQTKTKPLRLKYLRIQKPAKLYFPGKYFVYCPCYYITMVEIMINK
jgi:hypothetical protein